VTVVAPDLDLDRLAAVVERHGCTRLGLPLAIAHALAGAGGPEVRLRSVVQIVLEEPSVGAELAEQLRAVVPGAEVLSFPLPAAGDPPPAAAGDRAPVATSQEGMIWHEQLAPGLPEPPRPRPPLPRTPRRGGAAAIAGGGRAAPRAAAHDL
jgi:hypothetical protein